MHADNEYMKKKIEDKEDRKRLEEEEEARWQAQEMNGEEEGEAISGDVEPLTEKREIEKREMIELVEANCTGVASTLRMTHEKGEMTLKIADNNGFVLGALIVIGNDEDSIEVLSPLPFPLFPLPPPPYPLSHISVRICMIAIKSPDMI